MQKLFPFCDLSSSTPVFVRSVLHIFSLLFSVVFLFCALCLMLSVSLQFEPVLSVRVFALSYPCCDVRYDIRIKVPFGTSLPAVVCRSYIVFACAQQCPPLCTLICLYSFNSCCDELHSHLFIAKLLFIMFIDVYIPRSYYIRRHLWCNDQHVRLECGRSCVRDPHWLALNQDNVSDWSDISIRGLFVKCTSTMQNPTKLVGLAKSGPHHHLI